MEQRIREAGATIGLRASAQVAPIHMSGRTAPDDWTLPDREPNDFDPPGT